MPYSYKVTKAIQFASISGVPNISGMFDGEVSASGSSGGGINWNNIFGKLVDTGASLSYMRQNDFDIFFLEI